MLQRDMFVSRAGNYPSWILKVDGSDSWVFHSEFLGRDLVVLIEAQTKKSF